MLALIPANCTAKVKMQAVMMGGLCHGCTNSIFFFFFFFICLRKFLRKQEDFLFLIKKILKFIIWVQWNGQQIESDWRGREKGKGQRQSGECSCTTRTKRIGERRADNGRLKPPFFFFFLLHPSSSSSSSLTLQSMEVTHKTPFPLNPKFVRLHFLQWLWSSSGFFR